MKVVRILQENEVNQEPPVKHAGFIRMKKFHFVMLMFLIVFLSVGITAFALAFGDEKAVDMGTDRREFEKLYTAFDTLNNSYFQEVDKEKLINGAINGMVDALDDPYSDYMSVDEAKSFHQSISSSFEGIGAEIQEQGGFIFVVTPIKGSPAEKAGLKPNDKILSVDGKSIQGMSATEAVTLIRGKKGTKVELSIQRAGMDEALSVPIVRDTIPIETVYGEMMEDGIAKVQITSFSENTSKELIQKLNELQGKGMKGLVLDLRQNPGGLLNQAIEISSLFVPEGKTIFQVEERNGKREEYKSKGSNSPKIPLVVVIDKGSASASEILAGAVKESANVPLVGEKSFGKGTVQRAEDFADGSNLKYTTEKWLTPKGNWIHKKGINPDYDVALPEYASLPIINPDVELKLSFSSAQVKVAQQMLKAIGYDPGREDGFFDENTKSAVEKFQASQKLEVNGVLKGETTLKLMDQLREKLNKNDTQIQKAVEVLKQQLGK
ncbi:S41 family peptidase [Bacillus sp. S/N-304-OC-R1]|uniref:lmo1851 family serine protease n=1 Tax=Bacillus sp. S/N-304-OC-R1 TaxID=2758034 RepID=UPI001C8DCBA9|nr:S41 family peptidase [Bacillus sp. S/N-304-OC-R1]MBY0122742.1 PDZ domain-containing protein [Bacillus sp. S/N-304-OC-R1]